MRRALSIGLLLVTSFSAHVSASPVIAYDLRTPRGPEVLGELVPIRLVNHGNTTITMSEIWNLEYLDGDASAFYQWPEEELEIEPGESRVWMWDQYVDRCYGVCENVREGDPAQAGLYRVTTTVNGTEEVLTFYLGQLFTLGFRYHEDAEFTVFVATHPEVEQMTAEAQKPFDEKTLITSGIVRKRRAHINPDWNFSMGSRSIALGEVFIEVCDASPYYVQENRRDWLGERWCPWGSYVKRVGR